MDGAPRRVPFIGLTGGIGAGKSTALAALARMGARTISADAVVHSLYERAEIRDAVVARWGSQVAPGGVVDRSAVARCAFASPEEREWLESLIWPAVHAEIARLRADGAADPEARAIVVEAPLLFEGNNAAQYDATIAVVADEELRAARAAARGHESLEERAARQLSQAEKAALATYVVQNDGSEEELAEALSSVLGKLTV